MKERINKLIARVLYFLSYVFTHPIVVGLIFINGIYIFAYWFIKVVSEPFIWLFSL